MYYSTNTDTHEYIDTHLKGSTVPVVLICFASLHRRTIADLVPDLASWILASCTGRTARWRGSRTIQIYCPTGSSLHFKRIRLMATTRNLCLLMCLTIKCATGWLNQFWPMFLHAKSFERLFCSLCFLPALLEYLFTHNWFEFDFIYKFYYEILYTCIYEIMSIYFPENYFDYQSVILTKDAKI